MGSSLEFEAPRVPPIGGQEQAVDEALEIPSLIPFIFLDQLADPAHRKPKFSRDMAHRLTHVPVSHGKRL